MSLPSCLALGMHAWIFNHFAKSSRALPMLCWAYLYRMKSKPTKSGKEKDARHSMNKGILIQYIPLSFWQAGCAWDTWFARQHVRREIQEGDDEPVCFPNLSHLIQWWDPSPTQLTCAAMTLCLSAMRLHLQQVQSRKRQCRLCPFSHEIRPWFRHRAHFGRRPLPPPPPPTPSFSAKFKARIG